ALLDKILVSEFIGMSPLLAREVVYRYSKNTKTFAMDINPEEFADHTIRFIKEIADGRECATIVKDKDTQKPLSFSCVNLAQYQGLGNIIPCESISHAVEEFFAARDMHDRVVQKAAGTVKILTNNIERCEKKIAIHREVISKSEDREKYKICGDLLTANLYQIPASSNSVTVQNYYSENCEEITIKLKPELSPSQNAQRYYKLYSKAKTAQEHSTKQLQEALSEKSYLETVLDAVNRATDYSDIDEIREELL
ncbi:MAG: NFACT family protein, partial [Clostridia bacterium]|nr:NFACT family protein [Clostridia bacterium]